MDVVPGEMNRKTSSGLVIRIASHGCSSILFVEHVEKYERHARQRRVVAVEYDEALWPDGRQLHAGESAGEILFSVR